MVPNNYGLIRQKDLNLLALPFLEIIDNFSEYDIEVVIPIDIYPDKVYVTNGGLSDRTGFTAAIYDISKFDYVVFGVSGDRNFNTTSGLAESEDGTINLFTSVSHGGLAFEIVSRTNVRNNKYAKVSHVNGQHMPVLGFKRHRSDNVNPRNLRTMQDVELEQDETSEQEETAEQKKRK